MNNLLKYALMVTGALATGYAGYKTYEHFTAAKEEPVQPKPEAKKETKEEVKPEPVSPVKETIVEVEPEVEVQDETTAIEEAVVVETKVEEVYEPTTLEDVIQCFTKLLLLEDEGMDIQDKLNQYCDLILALKKAKGLNAKAFKATVKRTGVLPNSREWTRLFSDLRKYELQMVTEEV